MPILVDLNQVMISNIMVQIGNHQNAQIDENMIRHMVLNSLRANRMKFKEDFGDLVICADDKNYWRKGFFPYYKANRKKNREQSELDWNGIFNALNNIRTELKTVFPYKVIQIDRAEADDIIGTIVHKEGSILNTGVPILILSGDKDYIQLHKYGNVSQYDPVKKRWIRHDDPDKFLIEHILKGDSGDGIPNIMSADNCFMLGVRQKPMTEKRMEEYASINNLSEDLVKNYNRNKKLIDLAEVPTDIKDKIIGEYDAENKKNRSNLLNYFMEKNLRNLTAHLNEF